MHTAYARTRSKLFLNTPFQKYQRRLHLMPSSLPSAAEQSSTLNSPFVSFLWGLIVATGSLRVVKVDTIRECFEKCGAFREYFLPLQVGVVVFN